jgi:hypothetical protein
VLDRHDLGGRITGVKGNSTDFPEVLSFLASSMGFSMRISTLGWKSSNLAVRHIFAGLAGLAVVFALFALGSTGANAFPTSGDISALGKAERGVSEGELIIRISCRGSDCVDEAGHAPPCRERYAERWGGDPRYIKPRPPECGVRCMFHRLRHGFCGPGCDYYAFRMYEYEKGNVFHKKPCRY